MSDCLNLGEGHLDKKDLTKHVRLETGGKYIFSS